MGVTRAIPLYQGGGRSTLASPGARSAVAEARRLARDCALTSRSVLFGASGVRFGTTSHVRTMFGCTVEDGRDSDTLSECSDHGRSSSRSRRLMTQDRAVNTHGHYRRAQSSFEIAIVRRLSLRHTQHLQIAPCTTDSQPTTPAVMTAPERWGCRGDRFARRREWPRPTLLIPGSARRADLPPSGCVAAIPTVRLEQQAMGSLRNRIDVRSSRLKDLAVSRACGQFVSTCRRAWYDNDPVNGVSDAFAHAPYLFEGRDSGGGLPGAPPAFGTEVGTELDGGTCPSCSLGYRSSRFRSGLLARARDLAHSEALCLQLTALSLVHLAAKRRLRRAVRPLRQASRDAAAARLLPARAHYLVHEKDILEPRRENTSLGSRHLTEAGTQRRYADSSCNIVPDFEGGDSLGVNVGRQFATDRCVKRMREYDLGRNDNGPCGAVAADLVSDGTGTAHEVVYAISTGPSCFGALLAWRFSEPSFVCRTCGCTSDRTIFCGNTVPMGGLAARPVRLIARFSEPGRRGIRSRGWVSSTIDRVVNNGIAAARAARRVSREGIIDAQAWGTIRARFWCCSLGAAAPLSNGVTRGPDRRGAAAWAPKEQASDRPFAS
jgi:hypothetical protein